MEENYFEVLFSAIRDEKPDLLNIVATLILKDIETKVEKSIGYANLYILNETRVDSWNELINNADLISEDVLEVIEVLSKAKDNEKISGLIVVLDYIEIDKEYRGKDYCSELLDNILKYLAYINANYIGLIPARIYDDKVLQNEDKAINYYIEKGFKPICKKVGGNVVMGKSLIDLSDE